MKIIYVIKYTLYLSSIPCTCLSLVSFIFIPIYQKTTISLYLLTFFPYVCMFASMLQVCQRYPYVSYANVFYIHLKFLIGISHKTLLLILVSLIFTKCIYLTLCLLIYLNVYLYQKYFAFNNEVKLKIYPDCSFQIRPYYMLQMNLYRYIWKTKMVVLNECPPSMMPISQCPSVPAVIFD